MSKTRITICLAVMCVMAIGGTSMADTFGTGANQFTIDFVSISKATNPASGYGIVNKDYRMGTKEITNDQWTKFKASYGAVTGSELWAYGSNSHFTTGANEPTNNVSWFEAAQFVNWLNTSTGHQAAYKFTGIQGTSSYTFEAWSTEEAAGGVDVYRHKNSVYFLPTINEWLKAAYWNGTSLQTYASVNNKMPVAGVDSNYIMSKGKVWDVGSGSQELNSTFDMMGNVHEWIEAMDTTGYYGSNSYCSIPGGGYGSTYNVLTPSIRYSQHMYYQGMDVGFRVASIPEPASAMLMILGTAWIAAKRKR